MRAPADKNERLDELVDAICGPGLDADGYAELSGLLDGDRQAQRRYLCRVDLFNAIRWNASSSALHQTIGTLKAAGFEPVDVALARVERAPLAFVGSWVWPAAAILLFGLGLFLTLGPTTEPEAAGGPEPAVALTRDPGPAVFRIESLENVVWRVDGTLPVVDEEGKIGQWKSGDRLQGGVLAIDSGVVRLAIGGARVAIQGPARVDVEGVRAMRVSQGGIVVQTARGAHTPFVVRAPGVTVAERGTEMGLAVDAGGKTTISVYRGEVQATLAAEYTGMARALRLTRDDGIEVMPNGLATEGIVADGGRFEALRFDPAGRQPVLANASFEYPQVDGVASRAASGWKLLSHPVANANPMDIDAGVLRGVADARGLPAPVDGKQWAYLSAKTLASGRTAFTGMHQAVGQLEHDTTYRLRLEAGWPKDPRHVAGLSIGLYVGSKTSGPRHAVSIWTNPVGPVAGATRSVDLTYHAPAHSAYRGRELFVVIEAIPGETAGSRRVLVDNVRLDVAGTP